MVDKDAEGWNVWLAKMDGEEVVVVVVVVVEACDLGKRRYNVVATASLYPHSKVLNALLIAIISARSHFTLLDERVLPYTLCMYAHFCSASFPACLHSSSCHRAKKRPASRREPTRGGGQAVRDQPSVLVACQKQETDLTPIARLMGNGTRVFVVGRRCTVTECGRSVPHSAQSDFPQPRNRTTLLYPTRRVLLSLRSAPSAFRSYA